MTEIRDKQTELVPNIGLKISILATRKVEALSSDANYLPNQCR